MLPEVYLGIFRLLLLRYSNDILTQKTSQEGAHAVDKLPHDLAQYPLDLFPLC